MATTLLAGDVRPSNIGSVAFRKIHLAPQPPQIDRATAWDIALDTCRSTQRDAHDAEGHPGEALEDVWIAHSRAIDRLIVTPAPDRAALLLKIEFMASKYAGFAIEEMMLGALAADGRRLLAWGA